jgi:hypothetical protein
MIGTRNDTTECVVVDGRLTLIKHKRKQTVYDQSKNDEMQERSGKLILIKKKSKL